MTLNISLPTPLVKKADKAAKERFATRSDLIREALWVYLKDKDDWNQIFAWGKEAGRKMGIKSEEDVNKIIEDYRNEKRKGQGRS